MTVKTASPMERELDRVTHDVRRIFQEDRAKGDHSIMREWCKAPLDAWLGDVLVYDRQLSDENMNLLTVGMVERLSVRDALICTVLVKAFNYNADDCMLPDLTTRIAAEPQKQDTKRYVSDILNLAFHGKQVKRPDYFDMAIHACDDVLNRMDCGNVGEFSCCRLPWEAMRAYLAWFAGDFNKAVGHAIRALAIDSKYNLAVLVLSLCEHAVRPDYLSAANVPSND